MKIKVDKEKCIGCGTCAALCPDCFNLGEDGKSEVIESECFSCELEDIVASCPVGAIEIEEE